MSRLARLLALATALAGCAGNVQASDEPGTYTRAQSALIDRTAPGEVAMLGVSCERGETLLEGICDVGAGAKLVESSATGLGWACAASSTRDGVTLHVAIVCGR